MSTWESEREGRVETLRAEMDTPMSVERHDELDQLLTYYQPQEQDMPPDDEPGPISRAHLGTVYAAMTKRPIDWVWNKYLAIGYVSIFTGPSKAGKSTLLSSIAARVSNGWNNPDGTRAIKGKVIIITPEEEPDVTTLERIEIEGGNTNNIIDLTRVDCGIKGKEDFKLDNKEHMNILLENILYYKACLVLMDPLMSLSDKSLNWNQSARSILNPFQQMLQDQGCACILVNHFTKATKGDALSRMYGSMAIGQWARIIATVDRVPGSNQGFLHLEKNNLIRESAFPPDLFIQQMRSGRLAFSDGDASPSFKAVQEAQRMSMGRQNILKLLATAPMDDWELPEIHQSIRGKSYSTTRGIVCDMLKDGQIGQDIRGTYYSLDRAVLLASQQQQQSQQGPVDEKATRVINHPLILAEQTLPTNGHKPLIM